MVLKMAEKRRKINENDLEYQKQRAKNREAVKKFRIKEKQELEERKKVRLKMMTKNNKLKGKIHSLKKFKKTLIELLLKQSKMNGRPLTTEQLNVVYGKGSINDCESDDSSSSSSTKSSDSHTEDETSDNNDPT
jgi:hypothetical protein